MRQDHPDAGAAPVKTAPPSAEEVQSILFASVSPSDTRATVITPALGKKVRVLTCQITTAHSTANGYQAYFGTGAAITTDKTKAIFYAILDLQDLPTSVVVWPDGGGPVGDVDEVVSFRTNSDVGTDATIVITYREE